MMQAYSKVSHNGEQEGRDNSPVHATHVLTFETEDSEETPFLKGEVQPAIYQDLYFGYLFVFHIVAVLVTAMVYVPALFQQTDDASEEIAALKNTTTNDYVDGEANSSAFASNTTTKYEIDGEVDSSTFVKLLILISVITVITAGVVTLAFLKTMTRYPQACIYISLFVGPVLLFATALIFIVIDALAATTTTTTNQDVGDDDFSNGLVFVIFASVSALNSAILYGCFRRYVPFATSTIQAALQAISSFDSGLYVLSFGWIFISNAWIVLWIVTVVAVFAHAKNEGQVLCTELPEYKETGYYGDPNDMCDLHSPNFFAIMLLILSLYWTSEVIRNVLHCTTVGAIGSWWFFPVNNNNIRRNRTSSCCCSNAGDIQESLKRALTTSFGSICFGSLVLALIELMRSMARTARHRARNNHGAALLACIIECILTMLARFIEYFNSWAFVYVGLYGYSYTDAGKNVMRMFENRGWSAFLTDRLIFKLLAACNLAVGLFTGCLAVILVSLTAKPMLIQDTTLDGDNEDGMDVAASIMAFFMGFFAGLIISGSTLQVIESAVRTIIVCFAESPADFAENHPTLCEEMRKGWALAYPNDWTADIDGRFRVVNRNTNRMENVENMQVI